MNKQRWNHKKKGNLIACYSKNQNSQLNRGKKGLKMGDKKMAW